MNLTVSLLPFEATVACMAQFQSEASSAFFQESLYYFYPQFDRERMARLDPPGRTAYLRDTLSQVHRELLPQLRDKAEAYQRQWDQHRAVIQTAFEDLFARKLDGVLDDMSARVSLNPICPRYLADHSFDLFYLNSPPGALGLSLHEIVHFLWFQLWQEHFHDDPREYESPHLKWVLSEMVVDLFLSDPRLRPLNPYLADGTGTIYEYFHTMTIGGRPALERMAGLYRPGDPVRLMEQGYALCLEHEEEIRRAMG